MHWEPLSALSQSSDEWIVYLGNWWHVLNFLVSDAPHIAYIIEKVITERDLIDFADQSLSSTKRI